MSLSQPLSSGYKPLNAFLSSDEYILLAQLDPKFKHVADIQNELLENERVQSYLNNKPNQYDFSQTEAMGDADTFKETTGTGSMQSGGFLQALIPFLPVLGSVVAPVLGTIFSKLIGNKMSGSGRCMTQQEGEGFIGDIVTGFVNKNKDKLISMEQNLSNFNGKTFWNELRGMIKETVKEVLPQIKRVSPVVASKAAELLVNKVIPNKLTDPSVEGKGQKGGLQFNKKGMLEFADVVRPVVHFALKKIINNNDTANKIYKTLKSEIDKFANNEAKGMGAMPNQSGGFGFLDVLKGIAKTAFPIANFIPGFGVMPGNGTGNGIRPGNEYRGAGPIDFVKRVAKNALISLLPTITDMSKSAVSGLADSALSKFGIEGNNDLIKTLTDITIDTVGNTTKNLMEDTPSKKAKKITIQKEVMDVAEPVAVINKKKKKVIRPKKKISVGSGEVRFKIL